jgi:3'-5' exoribonuclease
MARAYIKSLSAGQFVDGEVYLLAQKDLRSTTQKSLYIHAVLADRTGQILARIWQASQELYDLLPQDGFVRVRGRTESYKGALQFIVEGIDPVPIEQVDLEEFLAKTEQDIDQMYKRLLDVLRGIKDQHLLYLVKQFVSDEPLMKRFKSAPAAIQMHHACIGGLLEHTLNVLELVLLIVPRYSQINPDLMLAGAFLHDIGKTRELTWDSVFKYTEEGQLVGHLLIGSMLVEEKAKAVAAELGRPFPLRLLQVIQHMILSHHGDYAFGSPKLPMTTEAISLHYLDNLDAKLDMARRQIAESDSTDPDADWTGYIKGLDRKLFKADVFKS